MTAITNNDSVWHNRNYLRLLAAQIISLIGTKLLAQSAWPYLPII